MHLKAGPDTLRVLNGVFVPEAFERRALIAAFNGPLEGYVDEFIDKHESAVHQKELPGGSMCYLIQDASWGKLKCAIIDLETQTPWSTHQFRVVDRIGMLFCVSGELGISLNERDPSTISHHLKPEAGPVQLFSSFKTSQREARWSWNSFQVSDCQSSSLALIRRSDHSAPSATNAQLLAKERFLTQAWDAPDATCSEKPGKLVSKTGWIRRVP